MKDQLKIFLAEDDRDDSFLFQEALNRLPYNVLLRVAEDGEKLIEMLDENKTPDFIFLDLNMPRKDGYESLNHIRSVKELQHITVIIMSTSSNKESVERAYNEGADMYIRKPDNFNSLINAIDACLKRKNKYPDKPSIDEFLLMV
jgi:CheY-like chemotaxis protein